MTESTTQHLLRHEIRDLLDPTTVRRDDHDRVAQRAGDVERTATCEALTVVALIVSGLVVGGMLLVSGAVNPLLFIGASLGGSAALVAGASACYLVTRERRKVRPAGRV